jgi:hypothetical protein
MKKLTTAIAALVVAGTANASDVYSYSSTFDLGELGISKLALEIPVGELDLTRGSSNAMEIRVEISGDDCRGDKEPEPTVLAKSRGDRLFIEVDGEDCTADLDIVLPESTELDVEMGVGSIDVVTSRNTRIEAGVGEVIVRVNSAEFNRMSGEVGVGEVSIRVDEGGNVESERFFITESVVWRGDGEHELDVDLGVGDVSIRERD